MADTIYCFVQNYFEKFGQGQALFFSTHFFWKKKMKAASTAKLHCQIHGLTIKKNNGIFIAILFVHLIQ